VENSWDAEKVFWLNFMAPCKVSFFVFKKKKMNHQEEQTENWNENSRVKFPALIHLTRLGYQYLSKDFLKNEGGLDSWTCIIKNLFRQQFLYINGLENTPENHKIFENEFQNLSLELGQDDLGQSFFNRLVKNDQSKSQYKLIDFEHFEKNSFHIATEVLYKNWEDEFKPDITVFVNGLPLSFIEVKKPNKAEGIISERNRMLMRMKNEKFRKFMNITQFMIFSNNMEYDDGEEQLQGAFYATITKWNSIKFNNFREQQKRELIDGIREINDKIESEILLDNNHIMLKNSPEFITNKNPDSPTNRILTSFFFKSRLAFFLKYSLVYVKQVQKDGSEELQKHIMRYPQFFATKEIEKKIQSWIKKGVIWHTQWSGKTALAFYNVKYLTDYFSKKGIIPRFYFIVDRIDLATQAKKEFRKRGLPVYSINSKKELADDFKETGTKPWMTVINIQKFNEDTTTELDNSYGVNLQRIYFIDEAHRSYDPHGSYLANLYNSDKQSIKIALTGTPLIIYKKHEKSEGEDVLSEKEEKKTTTNIFGEYIHKYYYNESIKDGYTLRLLREEIATTYKEKLRNIEKQLDDEVKKGILHKKDLFAHPKFVEPMLEYITDDISRFRIMRGDDSVGAMVVCDSSNQAREMFRIFQEKQSEHHLTWSLILHDEGDKKTREDEIENFKEGKIDILFVYAMLLTGFDAPRLKKLYLWRKIKAHNLLQTLTRVNRPYKNFRFGYVVDFANISDEFEATNQAYLDELSREYADYENPNDVFWGLFMSEEEINSWIKDIENTLLNYSTDNLELFSQQISAIQDKKEILNLKKTLEEARDLYNIARLLGHVEALEKIDIKLISQLHTETENRLKLLNLQQHVDDVSGKELLNLAIEDMIFDFKKIGEEELQMLANDYKEWVAKTREQLNTNRNQKDPEYSSLYEEWKRLIAKANINPEGENHLESSKLRKLQEEMKQIYKRISELNRKNQQLSDKFHGDQKYARIYKKMIPSWKPSDNPWLFGMMLKVKTDLDDAVQHNQGIIHNSAFFEKLSGQIISNIFYNEKLPLDFSFAKKLQDYLTSEYLQEYNF